MDIFTSSNVDQIEVTAPGIVQVLINKKITSNGAPIMQEPHRISLIPGCDLTQAKDATDACLAELGFPSVTDEDWTRVCAVANATWTAEVIEKYFTPRGAA